MSADSPFTRSPATRIRVALPNDQSAIVSLWRACGLTRPWNDPDKDIERKRAVDDGLFLVACHEERIVASAMGGYDGHRGWVYYVGVHPDFQRQGLARTLMQALEAQLLALGCPKINLQVREENTAALDFYARLGFDIDRSVSLGKRLIPDN